jgi:hypothetical protein
METKSNGLVMITTLLAKNMGETIGAVAWNAQTGVASFEYRQNS